MVLDYLQWEELTDDVLDLRETENFSYSTKESKKRDKNHPDNLNSRFNTATNEKLLINLQKGFEVFKKYWENWIFKDWNLDKYLNDLKYIDWNILNKFRKLWDSLKIDNIWIKTDSLILNWWPIQEIEQRVKDSVKIIWTNNFKKIITTWWITWNTGDKTEALYLKEELGKEWINWENILLEDKATNTWENAKFISDMLEWSSNTTIITTDYDSLRVALTAQAQMPFNWLKYTHGAQFNFNWEDIWDVNNWWLTENWWKATIYAISRLVKYRARQNPFL